MNMYIGITLGVLVGLVLLLVSAVRQVVAKLMVLEQHQNAIGASAALMAAQIGETKERLHQIGQGLASVFAELHVKIADEVDVRLQKRLAPPDLEGSVPEGQGRQLGTYHAIRMDGDVKLEGFENDPFTPKIDQRCHNTWKAIERTHKPGYHEYILGAEVRAVLDYRDRPVAVEAE